MDGIGPDALPRALAALESGRAAGLHMGAQMAVSWRGNSVCDLGLGEARAGTPMTADQIIVWFSMTKVVTSVAVAQVWERGLLDLDDPIAAYVPEFATGGKESVTVRHCLTHTGGFRSGDLARGSTWDEVIAAVCSARSEPGWVPGETAGYHLTAGMTMLAEVVRRVDGREFDRYVTEAIFAPLDMTDCWVGMPADRVEAYGSRLGTMHSVGGDGLLPLDNLDRGRAITLPAPASGGRGPMGQLVHLLEALLAGGVRNGARILGPQTVEAMVARHRTGRFDKTFGLVNEWALGLQVDSFSMGGHCSRRSFGHGGARSSNVFADPEHDLVVAVICNGMAEPAAHQQRMAAVANAVYLDLGLTDPGTPLREKESAKYA